MNFDVLVPITLFISIVYAIKVIADALVRRRLVESNGSEELVRSMLASEAERARLVAEHVRDELPVGVQAVAPADQPWRRASA